MAGVILLVAETDLLQLNGCVVNLKTATQNVAELFQNLMTVVVAANYSVAAHSVDSRG